MSNFLFLSIFSLSYSSLAFHGNNHKDFVFSYFSFNIKVWTNFVGYFEYVLGDYLWMWILDNSYIYCNLYHVNNNPWINLRKMLYLPKQHLRKYHNRWIYIVVGLFQLKLLISSISKIQLPIIMQLFLPDFTLELNFDLFFQLLIYPWKYISNFKFSRQVQTSMTHNYCFH